MEQGTIGASNYNSINMIEEQVKIISNTNSNNHESNKNKHNNETYQSKFNDKKKCFNEVITLNEVKMIATEEDMAEH